jgi:hypothetical protein
MGKRKFSARIKLNMVNGVGQKVFNSVDSADIPKLIKEQSQGAGKCVGFKYEWDEGWTNHDLYLVYHIDFGELSPLTVSLLLSVTYIITPILYLYNHSYIITPNRPLLLCHMPYDQCDLRLPASGQEASGSVRPKDHRVLRDDGELRGQRVVQRYTVF